MPVSKDDPKEWGLEENDWWYDDGNVWAMFTVEDNMAVIHEFHAHDEAKQGARTGIGRAAVSTFRGHFDNVVASGVGDPSGFPLHEDPAFLFWKKMLEEGRIDEIIAVGYDVTFNKGHLDEDPKVMVDNNLAEASPRPFR